jgi:hypothetical protein
MPEFNCIQVSVPSPKYQQTLAGLLFSDDPGEAKNPLTRLVIEGVNSNNLTRHSPGASTFILHISLPHIRRSI